MTVIQKLSDREGLIFEAIKMITIHVGNVTAKDLQWRLFQSGIYIKGSLLKQAIAVMKEKGELTSPDEVVSEAPKA
jgi:hypothetical protein